MGYISILINLVAALMGYISTLINLVAALMRYISTLINLVAAFLGYISTLINLVAAFLGYISTLINLVAEVHHHVSFHVAFSIESFPTDFTLEWFFTCVNPHVHFQWGVAWTDLAANWAHVDLCNRQYKGFEQYL